MQKRCLLFSFLLAPIFLLAQPKIQLNDFATGFSRPVDIAHCGDSRLFIVEQAGKIWIVDSLGVRLPNFFLDIDLKVYSNGNEQGLLGLAFDPDYAQNGYFYVNYINNNQNTVVSRFSRDSLTADKADPNSEIIVLQQTQPYSNHNGGCLKFSPVDGYLYIGLGDGGSGGDPQGNGQKKATFLGKILRIDVHAGAAPYLVPADNPFVGDTQYKPEIWSLGLRNPWRISFDRLTGDMWIGEVGQNAREEIDFEPAGTGGRNYGWRCYEGNQPFNTTGCLDASNYTAPVFDYANPSIGCSVTGGFIYRGAQYSDLYGVYLHTDYCSGRWWGTKRQADGSFATTLLVDLSDYQYSTLGEDKNGELYVAALSSGKIQKIKEICSPFKISGVSDGPVCDSSFSGTIFLEPTGATGIVSYFWSNGSTDKDIVYLNPGEYIVVATDGNGCVRRDTFVIQSASPAPPSLSVISGEIAICPGDTTIVEATLAPPGYDYVWYQSTDVITGVSGQQLTITEPGTYSAQFVGQGCNSSNAEVVTIVEKVLPVLEIAVAGQATLCGSGDSIFLTSTPAPQGLGYQWYMDQAIIPGATEKTLLVYTPGDYQVKLTGSNCAADLSAAVSVTQSVAPVIEHANGDILTISGSYVSIQWLYFNGDIWEPIPNANDTVYFAGTEGLFSVQVTDFFGCSFIADPVGIAATALPAAVTNFSLAPNPTLNTMELRLDLIKSEHVQFFLLDSGARQIFMQTHQSQSITKTFDLRVLPAGTYFLHVQMESGSFVRKVVKQ